MTKNNAKFMTKYNFSKIFVCYIFLYKIYA